MYWNIRRDIFLAVCLVLPVLSMWFGPICRSNSNSNSLYSFFPWRINRGDDTWGGIFSPQFYFPSLVPSSSKAGTYPIYAELVVLYIRNNLECNMFDSGLLKCLKTCNFCIPRAYPHNWYTWPNYTFLPYRAAWVIQLFQSPMHRNRHSWPHSQSPWS